MDAEIRTLEHIFSSPVQLQVPLYQRPYVWEQAKQWEPLWEDVRSVADRLRDHLAAGIVLRKAQTLVTPHFMGAVVLQQVHTAIGEMDRFAVIDGQQRLTTLQLLVDAAHAVVSQTGDAERTGLLALLVENTHKVKAEDDRFKILPTNVDRVPFREVMSAPPPVDHSALENSKARVVEAHRFFAQALTDWMSEATNEEDKQLRAQAITTVLLGMLNVVAIELDKDENAQLIFETLNARNTPLLASDLVKNVIFQRIEETDPGKSDALYEKYWRSLDAEEWRKTVRQGRLVRPRLDLFLYYWLIMHTGKSVTSHEVFSTIRELLHDDASPKDLLAAISANAIKYDSFEHAKPSSRLGTFRYRVIDVMQADAVTPVLLWLHDPSRPSIPPLQVELALASLESWLVRRMICRLTTKDYNRLFLDLIERLGSVDRAAVGDETRAFLAAQTADSRLWPKDDAVTGAIDDLEAYRLLSRARVRMLLEACEDRLRTDYSEQQVDRGKYTIEHVLPQTWRENWPLDTDDPERARQRNHLLHTLGNLTLVTKRLNPKLSNDAWADKRTTLDAHSVLRLNRDLLTQAPEKWGEEQIVARSKLLTHAVLAIWPRPAPSD